MTQQPPPPSQRQQPQPNPPLSLPAFPPAAGWGAVNADQMRPRPRRSLASALVALTGWTALTFLAAYGIGWLLLSVFDALSESANNADDTLSAAQIAGYTAIFALAMFVVHWVVGAVLVMLLRIGESFGAWSPLVQGLLVWVVSAPVAVGLLFLFLHFGSDW